MSSAALPSPRRWERDLFAFARAEMAGSPARWHAALRTTLACLVGVFLVATLQIPDGEFLMVSLFIVTKTDAWASMNRAFLRVIGTWVGGGLGILGIIAFGDKPWLLVPLQGVVIAAAIFFNRTTTAPYAFMIAGVTFLMVVPEYVSTPDFDLARGLWRTLLTTLGVVIGVAAQFFFWPDHPEGLLLDDLCRRLRLVETFVDRVGGAAAGRRQALVVDPVAATGMAGQLDLLKEAEATSPFLRQRHPEQIKLIVDVQRLVSAAIRLERRLPDGAALPPWAIARLRHVQGECVRLRQAIELRRPPAPAASAAQRALEGASLPELEALAAIEEMEEAVRGLPGALAFLETPEDGRSAFDDRVPREPLAERTLFTPACSLSNVEVLQQAIKGGLAASVCGLIYTTLQAPQLATCVITCLVVAQSTVGAGRHRSILRLVGTFIGGLGALLAILVLMPNMTSLASLLVVASPLFFVTAWILAGSSRVSYIGVQMGIGLSLVLINGPSPALDLSPALDRFLGIVIGTVVFGAIDIVVWPVFARTAIRRKLGEALRQMAAFQRASAARDEGATHRGAFAIYRTLSDAVALQDGLQLEPEIRDDDAAEREGAMRLTSSLQDTFLHLLAVGRHRAVLDAAPAAAVAGIEIMEEEAARHLEALAEGTEGSVSPSPAAIEALARASASPPVQELAVVYRGLLESLRRL